MFGEQIATEVIKELGIIESAKIKLVGSPDQATEKLEAVLEEIRKIPVLVEEVLTKYLSLVVDQASLQQSREILISLEGGKLGPEVAQGGPKSARIGQIYTTYLDAWFRKVLEPEQQHEVKIAFETLWTVDRRLFQLLDYVADWIAQEAQTTLTLVNSNRFDEANSHIRAAREEVIPLRRRINQMMRRLYKLEEAFIRGNSG